MVNLKTLDQMSKTDIEREVIAVIETFKDIMLQKYGISFNVYIPDPSIIRLKLEEIEKLAIEVLHMNESRAKTIKNMRVDTRKKEFIIHKTAFCLIAYEQGYSKSVIGRYLGRDHSSVINLLKSAEDYIDTKDKEFNAILLQLKSKIKNYVQVLSANIQSGVNTESTYDSVMPEGEDIPTVSSHF